MRASIDHLRVCAAMDKDEDEVTRERNKFFENFSDYVPAEVLRKLDKSADDSALYVKRPTDTCLADKYDIVVDAIESSRPEMEKLKKDLHMADASSYTSEQYCGPDEDTKICIWPGSTRTSWTELSFGYSWIGIHTPDTTCVLTTSFPISMRPANKTQLTPYAFLKVAIADMIGDTPTSFRNVIPQRFHFGPVVTVTVAPGHEPAHLDDAVRFLEEKLKLNSQFSSLETEQACGWGNFNGQYGRTSTMSLDRVLDALNCHAAGTTNIKSSL